MKTFQRLGFYLFVIRMLAAIWTAGAAFGVDVEQGLKSSGKID